ncbi:MAG: hypothetical protein AABZ47_01135 [Planctomycetota bacterium]
MREARIFRVGLHGLLISASFFYSTVAASTIRYVDANLTTGTEDGLSWANAYRTTDSTSGRTPLQRALLV